MAVVHFRNQARRRELGKLLFDWIVDHRSGRKSLSEVSSELHEWLKTLGDDVCLIKDEQSGEEVPYPTDHVIKFLADGSFEDNLSVLVLPVQLADDKFFPSRADKEAQMGDYFMKKCR